VWLKTLIDEPQKEAQTEKLPTVNQHQNEEEKVS